MRKADVTFHSAGRTMSPAVNVKITDPTPLPSSAWQPFEQAVAALASLPSRGICGAPGGAYRCTEPAGHSGNHAARGLVDMTISSWTPDHDFGGSHAR